MATDLVKAPSHTLEIPSKWQERFIIKRIGDDDIEISLDTRNGVLDRMARGERYVQIGKTTLMLNSIKSIEPKWGEKNIPPRPRPSAQYDFPTEDLASAKKTITNQDEIDEWERVFGEKARERDYEE